MARLIVSAQMTMDSVIDHMEGWLEPKREDPDGVAQLRAADALILGRKTYEGLAEYWPSQEGAYAELVNPIPKTSPHGHSKSHWPGTRTCSALTLLRMWQP